MNDHDALFFVCHILGMSARLWSCAEETAGQAASENDAHIGTGWQRMISYLNFSYPTVCHMPFLYHAFSYSVILSCDNLVTMKSIEMRWISVISFASDWLLFWRPSTHCGRAVGEWFRLLQGISGSHWLPYWPFAPWIKSV